MYRDFDYGYKVTYDKIVGLVDNILDVLEGYYSFGDSQTDGYVEHKDDSIVFDLPAMGYEKDEISISYSDGFLKVSFKSKDTNTSKFKKDPSYYTYKICKEKYDIDKLEAILSKGILTITIPKKEEEKAKEFTIRD